MSDIKVFEDLTGKTLLKVENVDNDFLFFVLNEDEAYMLYHDQDCCEYVRIEDIIGDLDDLVGSPLLLVEEVSSLDEPYTPGDYYTWTFYKMSTIKGSVTIRWLGESNGYYSESVDFARAKKCNKCGDFCGWYNSYENECHRCR